MKFKHCILSIEAKIPTNTPESQYYHRYTNAPESRNPWTELHGQRTDNGQSPTDNGQTKDRPHGQRTENQSVLCLSPVLAHSDRRTAVRLSVACPSLVCPAGSAEYWAIDSFL